MGRPLDRRRLTRAFSVLALLPVLLGGRWAVSYRDRPTSDPGTPSRAVVWVFYGASSWGSPDLPETLGPLGGRIRYRSEWLRAYSVELPSERLLDLARVPGVLEIRPVASLFSRPASVQTSLDSIYGGLTESLVALGVPEAHALGLVGSGVRVGILDGTFLDGHVTVRDAPPLAARDFVDGDASPFPDVTDPPGSASHGTALWSLVAGDSPGLLVGAAPGVDVLLARVRSFADLSRVDEDRWVAGLEWLESQGARIVLSGVGFRNYPEGGYSLDDLDGDSTPATRAADQAAQRGVLVVAPMGNDGPGISTLTAPADGDSVLAVGAVDGRKRPTAFTASGPTGDGREKPDLFAPGQSLEAASAASPQTLEAVSGTEFAAALLTGVLALAVEAHPDRGPMELVEMLRLSVPELNGGQMGIPHAAGAILFPDGLFSSPLGEVDGDGVLTNLAPVFQWTAPTTHPIGLPVTFHLELARDSLFSELVQSDSVVGTFARRPSDPLPPRSELFWRVRAVSVRGVERVTATRGPVIVPSWVRLEVVNDPSGSELVDPQPDFRWTSPELLAPAGPLVYELQVVSDRESEVIQSHPELQEMTFGLPEPLPFNLPMRWRVIATARNGMADTVTSAGPFVITSGARPPATILYQNFPNPFPNPEFGGMATRIWFDLAVPSPVELAVYDIRGRLVRRLIPGRGCGVVELEPGLYGRDDVDEIDPCISLFWNGLNDMGREVAPGVYLLRLRAGGITAVRRVVYWP